ncbi:retrotransposon protein, putative, ty1-copia subclass [Tanacetum coccineum]
MFVIEQPLPATSAADSEAQVRSQWNAVYDAYNEVACLILGRKDKQVYISKPKNPKPSAKEHPAKDDTCHHCKEVGHWKRNCLVYLAELLKKKKQVGIVSSSDNCHYAPSITRGVVSVYRLVENRFVQYFMDFGILVSKNNVLYFNVIPSNGIYEINMHNLVSNDNSIYNVSTKRAKHKLDSTYLWHCRLAHISRKRIEKLQQEGLLKLTDDESFDQCVSCLSGKMTRKSFPHRPKKVTDLLGIIHTNMCGPLRHVSRQGASYFITFTDDYSRYGYVYLLKHKHEVFKTFKVFKNEVENQLGKRIKALRSDRDSEYISQEFKDYLKACEIVQHLTHPYTPQYNGVSERRNRTLLDMVRSMINLTTLSISFWDYALESATRILNMVPTKKVDNTPYELWIPKGNEASWHWKRNFPIYLAELLQKKKQVGIASSSEFATRHFNMVPTKKVDKTPYELWYEKVPNLSYLKVWGCEALVKRDTLDKLQQRSVKCIFIGIPKKRSERTHQATTRLCLNVESEEHSLGDLNEPTSYKAAMLDPEFNRWLDAMNAEMQSMIDNMVWVLVDLPPNSKGYTQLYGVDYEETFSLVTNIRAIRILISIAAFYDYEIWQMDVKTALLNGYLDEDIYMVQPEDDIIIMGNHILSLQSVNDYLGKCFSNKDLGEATIIIGIKIYRDSLKRLIRLSQSAYMDKILKRYKMDNSIRGHIPMQERLDLNKTQERVRGRSLLVEMMSCSLDQCDVSLELVCDRVEDVDLCGVYVYGLSLSLHSVSVVVSRYGYIKNHKKTVTNRQAQTRESEEYKKKPKNQGQSQKVKDRSQIQLTWSTAVNHYKTKPHNNPIPVLQLSQKSKNVPSSLIGPRKA